jgi:hypothetical protein
VNRHGNFLGEPVDCWCERHVQCGGESGDSDRDSAVSGWSDGIGHGDTHGRDGIVLSHDTCAGDAFDHGGVQRRCELCGFNLGCPYTDSQDEHND